jgi:hypothetical protein
MTETITPIDGDDSFAELAEAIKAQCMVAVYEALDSFTSETENRPSEAYLRVRVIRMQSLFDSMAAVAAEEQRDIMKRGLAMTEEHMALRELSDKVALRMRTVSATVMVLCQAYGRNRELASYRDAHFVELMKTLVMGHDGSWEVKPNGSGRMRPVWPTEAEGLEPWARIKLAIHVMSLWHGLSEGDSISRAASAEQLDWASAFTFR